MQYIYGGWLMHHGIQGQKWGVRRFQNEDGSLTEAGQARYGGKKEYNDNVARGLLTGRVGNFTGGRSMGEQRSYNMSRRIDKKRNKADIARLKGNEVKARRLEQKAKALETKKRAQDAANSDREAYDRHTSTGKMLVQNLLMTGWGAEAYRNARARGNSRGKALVSAMLLDPVGDSAKVYGSHTL